MHYATPGRTIVRPSIEARPPLRTPVCIVSCLAGQLSGPPLKLPAVPLVYNLGEEAWPDNCPALH